MSQSTTRRKTPELRDRILNKDRPVTDDELEELLKGDMYTLKELAAMGVTELQVQKLRREGNKLMHQYEIRKKAYVYYILEHGEDPFTILPQKENQRTWKIAYMADIHVGSNEFDRKKFVAYLQYLRKAGYDILFISGDLLDAMAVYSGHNSNLTLATAILQADEFVAIFDEPGVGGFKAIVACDGNHDQKPSKEGGIRLLDMIEQKMVARGKPFTALKSTSGYVRTGNCLQEIIHMDGPRGNTQSETYSPQRLLDQTSKSTMGGTDANQVRIFGELLPAVSATAGHWHGVIEFAYGRNFLLRQPGTMQYTTDFIRRRGIRSRPCGRVAEITLDEECKQIIYHKGSLIFLTYLEDINELEAQLARSRRRGPTIKSSKTTEAKYPQDLEIDDKKIEKAITKLKASKKVPFDELGLTREEIAYINSINNYNIYVAGNTVVWKTDAKKSHIIHSPEPKSGIVRYMICANGLIGSEFFDEEGFRFILDQAQAQGVKHVHFGGDMVWGDLRADQWEHTTMFEPTEQIEAFVNILADYPDFHYFSINGPREKSFIEHKTPRNRINPMIEVSRALAQKGVKFTAVNSHKCDIVINGVVFRDINLHKNRSKHPYTRDVDVTNDGRSRMSKLGNKVIMDCIEYPIGVIFYGSIPNTQETYSGGIYIETTGGPSWDPDNANDFIQSNCEGKILTAYMTGGKIVRLESEIIFPPLNTIALPR